MTIIVDLGNVLSGGKRRNSHSTKKSSSSTSTTLEPTNTSAAEKQGQMIHGDVRDKSSIKNGTESFDFNFNNICLSPMTCCDAHVNWECLVLEEEAMKEKVDDQEKALAWEEEDIEGLLCEEDEMVDATPWLWDAGF